MSKSRLANWFLCDGNPEKEYFAVVPRANWGTIDDLKLKTGYNQITGMYFVLITDKNRNATFRINITQEHYQNFFKIAKITHSQHKKPGDPVLYSDVNNIRCFCFACAIDMGSVDYVRMNGNYPLHIPLCYDCWTKTGMKMVQPSFGP